MENHYSKQYRPYSDATLSGSALFAYDLFTAFQVRKGKHIGYFIKNCFPSFLKTNKLVCWDLIRLISVEDVRKYLSHTIYFLIFVFCLNFLLFVRLQTPRCWMEV